MIHDNAAHGIEIVQGTSSMHGNTIVGNAGAGIHVASGGKPYTQTIAADIAAFNGTAGLFGDAGGIYNVACCDVWNNGPAGGFNYAGAIADRTGVEGNISLDPLFCDRAAGNLSLFEGSPALAQSCGPMGARRRGRAARSRTRCGRRRGAASRPSTGNESRRAFLQEAAWNFAMN